MASWVEIFEARGGGPARSLPCPLSLGLVDDARSVGHAAGGAHRGGPPSPGVLSRSLAVDAAVGRQGAERPVSGTTRRAGGPRDGDRPRRAGPRPEPAADDDDGRRLPAHPGRALHLADHHPREAEGLFPASPSSPACPSTSPSPATWSRSSRAGSRSWSPAGSTVPRAAYVNVCRHRGATVVRDRGHVARSSAAPSTAGSTTSTTATRRPAPVVRRLRRPRPRRGDGGLGLPAVPVAERHGIVVVRPGGGAPIDVDAWLGGLGADLAARRYDRLIPYDRTCRRGRATGSC